MTTTTTTPPRNLQPEPSGKPSRRRRAAKSSARGGKVSRPGTATVNLLSPWVFEDLRVHQLRRRFLFGGLLLLVVIALVWVALRFDLHRANEDLRGEEAVGVGLTNQLRELGPVRTYVDSVDHRVIAVKGATFDDVAFSRVLAALEAAMPPTAALNAISVELAPAESDPGSDSPDQTASSSAGTGTAGARSRSQEDPARGLVGTTCPGPDPFGTKVVVGCLTISGTATSRDAVGALVIALGDDKLFVEPFVDTTTTGDADAVTFSGSVGLSPAVFSGRYDSLGNELTKGATK